MLEGWQVVKSIARTNKLYCGFCKSKIKKGDVVIFDLMYREMTDCYCENCGKGQLQEYWDSQIEAEVVGHGQS